MTKPAARKKGKAPRQASGSAPIKGELAEVLKGRRLKVIYRPLADLKDYGRNARTHSAGQVAEIAASMTAFGWTNPILIDEGDEIIAGHGRKLAALKNGYVEGPTITLTGLSGAQKRALRIADNKLAMNAGWDLDLLREELGELKGEGFDIGITGFGEFELEDLMNPGAGNSGAGSLAEKFGIPPFSVLNAREGWWQTRKEAWLSLGIQSELGRGENLLKFSATVLEPDPKKRARKKAAAEAGAS